MKRVLFLACMGVITAFPLSAQELRLRDTLAGHTGVVSSIAFSPDGKTLASGSWDKTIRLWDVATGKNTASLKGHTLEVLSVAYSPDGKTLASGSDDQTVRLWDVAKHRAIGPPLTRDDVYELLNIVGALEGLGARGAARLPHAERRALVRDLKALNNPPSL